MALSSLINLANCSYKIGLESSIALGKCYAVR